MSRIADRLKSLGIALPRPAAPVANYVPAVLTTGSPLGRSLLIVSGQLPFGLDGRLSPEHIGKLGPASTIDNAREAARLCAINLIAQAEATLRDLDYVARVVRLGGFFNIEGSFDMLPQAMNGASDLMADVFGEHGRHARTTVGVSHLPLNALCEVDAMFEVTV